MKTITKILISVLVIVILGLLARFVIFKKQFEDMDARFDSMTTWQENYRSEHPDATKEQMDAAFNAGIANIKVWQAQYKKDHPDATKAEMDAAFSAMFKN